MKLSIALQTCVACCLFYVCYSPTVSFAGSESNPNIVFILADDMGYGDVQSQNPDSVIPTPHLDGLAASGMRFTDAHSPSAVCTPTRYGVLTGRYCWRTELKRGVLGGYNQALIDPSRQTVGNVLKDAGYHTAAIGKWHLGMSMSRFNDEAPKQDRWDGDGNVDFTAPILEGPTTRGFDYYFGVSASFDMPPYVWIENDRFTKPPTIQHPGEKFPRFIRKGPQADDVDFESALDVLADKAGQYIRSRAKLDQPFFLYLPLTGPHKPVVPHKRFQGKSKRGLYGDFVMNVDECVGNVLRAIDDSGERDNTVVVFTSDNGSFMYRYEKGTKDHLTDETIQGFDESQHRSNGENRGTKADIWEGGHRVPFLVRWPGKATAGSTCNNTITHTDFLATAAEIAGVEMGENVGEDSFSIVPLLTNGETKKRAPVIHHSASGMFAIRDGKWKLVAGNGSGGRQQPRGKAFTKPYWLTDMEADPGETTNVAAKHTDVVQRLEATLIELRDSGRSR